MCFFDEMIEIICIIQGVVGREKNEDTYDADLEHKKKTKNSKKYKTNL